MLIMKKVLYISIIILFLWVLYFYIFIFNKYENFDKLWYRINDWSEYITVNTMLFEDYIKNKNIKNSEDIVNSFFIFLKYDFIPDYYYSLKEKDNNILEITFTYKSRSDSVSEHKKVILIDFKNKKIFNIKENWKCRSWRGHFYWWIWSCY